MELLCTYHEYSNHKKYQNYSGNHKGCPYDWRSACGTQLICYYADKISQLFEPLSSIKHLQLTDMQFLAEKKLMQMRLNKQTRKSSNMVFILGRLRLQYQPRIFSCISALNLAKNTRINAVSTDLFCQAYPDLQLDSCFNNIKNPN